MLTQRLPRITVGEDSGFCCVERVWASRRGDGDRGGPAGNPESPEPPARCSVLGLLSHRLVTLDESLYLLQAYL